MTTSPNGNGNGNRWSGPIATMARDFMNSIPPAFVVLCLINVLFLYSVLAFVQNQTEQRVALINRLLDSCTMDARPRDRDKTP
jgi:hypothetical protein